MCPIRCTQPVSALKCLDRPLLRSNQNGLQRPNSSKLVNVIQKQESECLMYR